MVKWKIIRNCWYIDRQSNEELVMKNKMEQSLAVLWQWWQPYHYCQHVAVKVQREKMQTQSRCTYGASLYEKYAPWHPETAPGYQCWICCRQQRSWFTDFEWKWWIADIINLLSLFTSWCKFLERQPDDLSTTNASGAVYDTYQHFMNEMQRKLAFRRVQMPMACSEQGSFENMISVANRLWKLCLCLPAFEQSNRGFTADY